MFTRGQLAKACGVTTETIRFYERKKLLNPKRISGRSYWFYDEQNLKRLRFILTAKAHGFTLKEIQELIELRVSPTSTCNDVKERAERKLEVIEQKIQELEQMKRAIQSLISSCKAGGPVGDCPIIEAFEEMD